MSTFKWGIIILQILNKNIRLIYFHNKVSTQDCFELLLESDPVTASFPKVVKNKSYIMKMCSCHLIRKQCLR